MLQVISLFFFRATRNRNNKQTCWAHFNHSRGIVCLLCLRCEKGYIGSRCEYVDLAWRIGDQRQIIIACVIAALVFLILLITFICICAQWVKYTFLKHQTARLLYVVTFHVCVCLYLFVFVCLWEWEVAIQTHRLTACHTNPGMGCKESMCVPWMEK